MLGTEEIQIFKLALKQQSKESFELDIDKKLFPLTLNYLQIACYNCFKISDGCIVT